MQQQAIQEAILLANQLEGIFETLGESVIACDCEGKILHINAAALTLFEVASASLCRGKCCQQFLHSYQIGDEQPPALSLEPWLMSLFSDGEEATSQQEAIAHLPEQMDFASPEGLFLLSPPVLFVTRQLVEVIGQVLVCQQVALWAFRPPAGYAHYVLGSGYTWEQEQVHREKSGHILLSEFVDETALARLSANQE